MFKYSYFTTEGVKKINQDALLIKRAAFRGEEILFAVVCDGIGGLTGGENASSFVISGVSAWFENDYAALIKSGKSILDVRSSLDACLHRLNDDINSAAEDGMDMGTTYTSILIDPVMNKLLVAHVGDTRLYKLTDTAAEVITSDHSVVADEVRRGIITEEQAKFDSRQNQITNCIGAGETDRMYDYIVLEPETDCTYMLCSDGFRKMISKEEMYTRLGPSAAVDDKAIRENLSELVSLDLERNENDNITALAVRYIKEK